MSSSEYSFYESASVTIYTGGLVRMTCPELDEHTDDFGKSFTDSDEKGMGLFDQILKFLDTVEFIPVNSNSSRDLSYKDMADEKLEYAKEVLENCCQNIDGRWEIRRKDCPDGFSFQRECGDVFEICIETI